MNVSLLGVNLEIWDSALGLISGVGQARVNGDFLVFCMYKVTYTIVLGSLLDSCKGVRFMSCVLDIYIY